MRRNLKTYLGLEGGNFTTEVPSTVVDDSGSADATVVPEKEIDAAADNSSTIVVDTQNDDQAIAVEPVEGETEETVKEDLVPKKKMVFLGGTCNESTWRDKLIEGLEISYFNPVVQDWTKDDKEKEDQIKDSADYNLFVFTPKHTGFFSFVEATLLAVKSSSRTILCVLQDDDGATFDESTKRSVDETLSTLKEEGIKVFDSLDNVRTYLNGGEAQEVNVDAPVAEEPVTETPPVTSEPVDENKDSAELETSDATVSVKVDTGSDDSVATEGLGTTIKTWREGSEVAATAGERRSQQYLTLLYGYEADYKKTIKNSSWWLSKKDTNKTLRLNYVDMGRFCRNGKVVSNPIDELLKEIIFLSDTAKKYLNNIKTFASNRPAVLKELTNAKSGSDFNAICDKWNKKNSTYPADEFLGRKHSFMNDFGTGLLAFRKDGWSAFYSYPFWSDKKHSQGDVSFKGKSDIEKLIKINDICLEMLKLAKEVDDSIDPSGYTFNKDVVDNAWALDHTKFSQTARYISWNFISQWATRPIASMQHYFGATGETINRIIKKYENEVK